MDPHPSAECRPRKSVAQSARSAPAPDEKLSGDVEAALMSREYILHRIRTSIGRSAGQPVADPPPVRLRIPQVDIETRIATMRMRIEALGGKTAVTADPRAFVAEAIAGKTAVASNSPYLAECGITQLPGVRFGILDREKLRNVCATIDIGI